MAKIPTDYLPLEGTERAPRHGARRLGPADPHEKLTVSIRVRSRADAPPLPNLQNWTADSPGQIRLSRKEFAARFGSSEADLALVVDFGRAHGLTLVEASGSRRTVVFSGTVQQMNRTFGVDLGRYESSTENYRGREGPVHLPKALAGIVDGVFGLDNRRMARRGMGGAPGPAIVTPREVAELYNFPLSAGATGQTIGILEFGGGYKVDKHGVATDIAAYFDGQGLITPALYPIATDGVSNSPGDAEADPEVALDIEVAGAVAQGANIAVYFAPFTEQGWVDVVTNAVHGIGIPNGWAEPSVVTVSWTWAELEAFGKFAWTGAAIDCVTQTFQEAAMLGVTVLVSSGDYGSDCGVGDKRAHVEYPASDPGVIACGGTSIQSVSSGSFTEVTWNDHDPNDPKDVTGGGISAFFALPDWQKGAGLPGSVNNGQQGRGIPDIAGHADGYSIFLNGAWRGPYGGTSEVAPLYAGLIALINALLGDSIGYLNPILYQAGTSKVFRDIADGETNSNRGAPGYTAGPGWDACTGWGSVDGTWLLNVVETYLFSMILPALL